MDIEILKIVVPSLTTIIVALVLGLWLNQKNEAFKSELQLKILKQQAEREDKKNQIAKLEELHQLVNDTLKYSSEVRRKVGFGADPIQESFELTEHLTANVNRIATLYCFYCPQDSEIFQDFLSSLLEFQVSFVRFLENKTVENQENYYQKQQEMVAMAQPCLISIQHLALPLLYEKVTPELLELTKIEE